MLEHGPGEKELNWFAQFLHPYLLKGAGDVHLLGDGSAGLGSLPSGKCCWRAKYYGFARNFNVSVFIASVIH